MKTFNFDDKLPVGKYTHKTFKEVSEQDADYFDWFLTKVINLPNLGCNFMYAQEMEDLKWKRRKEKSLQKQKNWNIKYGNTTNSHHNTNKRKYEFKTVWAEDVYGGYNSGIMQ